MANKERCRNMNHGRINVAVKFCPDCGEKFDGGAEGNCNDTKHKQRMKARDNYCCDCGKSFR